MRSKGGIISRANTLILMFLLSLLILTVGCRNDKGVLAPVISSFTPNSGEAGDTVTITGKNFSTKASQNTVKFNGTVAVVTSSTSTQIVTIVPSGATTGKITVTKKGLTATSSSDFTVGPAMSGAVPSITGFTPENGQVGDTVIITGTNFSTTPADNTVRFNGTAAVVVGSTSTQITTAVPEGASTGKITVTVGGNTASSSADFTVDPSATIDQPVFGGQYEDDEGNTLPCYWIGDERVELPVGISDYGWALSPTAVVGSTVYAAGEYYDPSSHKTVPCYWDGSAGPHVLPLPAGAYSFQVSGIAVSNGTVYTVGHYDYQYDADHNVTVPCIWINTNEPQMLTDPLETGRAWAYAITVSNGTTYVAGKYLDTDTSSYKACYWQGATLVDLPVPADASDIYASAITVSGGTVYTAGTYYYYDNVLTSKACYWTGDDETTILDSPAGSISEGSRTSSIVVWDGEVYVSGEYWRDAVDRVCYWQDGELVDVTSPGGSVDQYSSAMTLIDGAVYIGGGYNYMHDYNYYWRACNWTDTAITTLNDIDQDSYVNSSMWWWD